MSDHTNQEYYFKDRWISQHVGGHDEPSDNHKYTNQQAEIIRDGRRELPPRLRDTPYIPPYPTYLPPNNSHVRYNREIRYQQDIGSPVGREYNTTETQITDGNLIGIPDSNGEQRYDPYEDFLYKHGLLDYRFNRRRFKTTYLNISSAFRKKNPSLNLGESYTLYDNPLCFKKGSNLIYIKHKHHPFEDGELISITCASSKHVILRTYDTKGEPTFVIPKGCNVMKVYYPHQLPPDYSGNEIAVEFHGIKGDHNTNKLSSFLGNIPVNLINDSHIIYVTLTQEDLDPNCDLESLPGDFLDYSNDHFFIILPKTMHNPPPEEEPYILREYNFKLKFLSIAGIPLNTINARYPIDPYHIHGYHIIKYTEKNGYTIEVPFAAIQDIKGGGNNVIVTKIKSIDTGYPNPNKYRIDLGRTFHDVISVRIVSTEFPNSGRAIKDYPKERINNKLYWNNIDDGDYLYYIEIPSGNYDPNQLANEIEKQFSLTSRINTGDEEMTHEPYHFVLVDINMNTDIIIFKSYKKFILVEPFISTEPEINIDPEMDENDLGTIFTLNVKHPKHGMITAGDKIIISGSLSYFGIPAFILNGEHIVSGIIDENQYQIKLPKVNLMDERDDNKGGAAVSIMIPDYFRLRFDKNDTIGSLIGFRNPGNPTSITNFNKVITNSDLYAYDTTMNTLGESVKIKNNCFKLMGDDYFLMVARPLETLVSIGPIKEAFAKIQIRHKHLKTLFNTFVPTSRFYNDPIHELSELEIEFFAPDGSLFDFNGCDHSFTIEIVDVHDIPKGSGISPNTGQNYNIVV